MSEHEFNELRELSWRRPLTAVEEARLQAYLSANPSLQAAWEEESALTHALSQLPAAPVSSNFTALVLQSLDQPERKPAGNAWAAWLPRLFPRVGFATACVLLMAGYLVYHTHQRQQLAKGVDLIVSAVPEQPDAFVNFDAIQKLGPDTGVDETLWVALNQ
jgi:hypothetical protein